jgi:putative resolvase
MMDEKTYSTGQFAKKIGITTRTLQRWDLDGKFTAYRSATGRRFYTETQYREYMGMEAPCEGKKVVCYTRVSSNKQKPDLKNQVAALEQFVVANGLAVDEWVSEIGSGLNYERKQFNRLLKETGSGKISKIIVAHKDRFIRFGFEWFDNYCKDHGCEIVVVNLQSLSPEEEVTQDLLTIIDCFSSRLYGLRRYKKDIEDMVQAEEE